MQVLRPVLIAQKLDCESASGLCLFGSLFNDLCVVQVPACQISQLSSVGCYWVLAVGVTGA